ncbi:NAD(P)-dependent oxidoreductase [Vibrio campbellii]|uniref:NAD(P)-dependent oxidoreductase n=1 Tax=Vibrio campbellii TaxID=680 RepID=UPI0005EEB5C6|nr:NAD(P)-dependent oxidoreductase [Vibrio campbellii]
MKVLIAGANGYIGRNVTAGFAENGFEVFTYSGKEDVIIPSERGARKDSAFTGYFDVVVNCARPHWSEFSPKEITDIESKLLMKLDRFAAKGAIKIHTSGVWLFGNASCSDLKRFRLKPMEPVKLDVATIERAIKRQWHIVYCPSLVYGGENCQLKRIVESFPSQTVQVAIPSQGYNQYIHVCDITRFYLSLVQQRPSEIQHFIAEPKGYSPEEFSQLLLDAKLVRRINRINWDDFELTNGFWAVEIEKLNLSLPISPLFTPTKSVRDYIESC